jgi:hypothetical protein
MLMLRLLMLLMLLLLRLRVAILLLLPRQLELMACLFQFGVFTHRKHTYGQFGPRDLIHYCNHGVGYKPQWKYCGANISANESQISKRRVPSTCISTTTRISQADWLNGC